MVKTQLTSNSETGKDKKQKAVEELKGLNETQFVRQLLHFGLFV